MCSRTAVTYSIIVPQILSIYFLHVYALQKLRGFAIKNQLHCCFKQVLNIMFNV